MKIKRFNFLLSFLLIYFILGCGNDNVQEDKPLTDSSLLGAWQVNTDEKAVWLYKIGYQDRTKISGNKVIYSSDTPMLISFIGTYDSTTRNVRINEKKGNQSLTGTFEGQIDGDIKNFLGNWQGYDSNKMSLKIQKSEKNHNKIEYPYFYEADVALEFSEAYYRGSFGISKPQTVEITPNYKSDIGKTFYLGSFEKNKEIEFFIHVNNTGITYYSGKYNNASVVQLSSESWKIYFKDSEDIDRDFNDLIVKVSVDKIPEPEYRPSDPKINDINTGWCYPLKDLCSNFIKKLAFQNPFLILLIDFIELNKPEPARAVAAGWDCLYQNGLWRLTMA